MWGVGMPAIDLGDVFTGEPGRVWGWEGEEGVGWEVEAGMVLLPPASDLIADAVGVEVAEVGGFAVGVGSEGDLGFVEGFGHLGVGGGFFGFRKPDIDVCGGKHRKGS